MNKARKVLAVTLSLAAALLAGCGGGGGGGGGPAATVLSVTTDWTNHANSGGGISERLDLYNANGLLAQELEVNQDVPGLELKNFSAVAPGVYHLAGQLWSQTNLGGVQTGYFDTFVDLAKNNSVRIGVGNAAASVAVSPPTASIMVQQSQQFYATVKDSTGDIVYTPTAGASVSWSTLGGTATVGANSGIAVGTNVGNSGFVQATYTPGNLIGAATLSVSAFTVTQSKWTVLVYMNASNDLDQFSLPNIQQMQKVADMPGNVRFVVQWKQVQDPTFSLNPTFVGTRRYLIRPASQGNQLIQDMGTGIDMGNAQTMADFINWGKTYFPATRYCVVVWNHGNGWASGRALAKTLPTRGYSYDYETGNNIDTWQLSQSLGTLQPDILAWDCSLMQMMEVAYEARNQVKYVVGSEASPPGPGYPYDQVFANFRSNPDSATSALTKSFVDAMIQAYPTSTGFNMTQSVLDTSKISALSSSISSLADALVANMPAMQNTQVVTAPPLTPFTLTFGGSTTASITGSNVTGTSTGSNTSSTLNDATQSWTTNQFVNGVVSITGGTGVGQNRTITSSSATTLSVSPAWSTIPDATSSYSITVPVSATDVQTALAALSNVGSGNASVAGPGGGPWTVTFQGALAGAAQPTMTSDFGSVATLIPQVRSHAEGAAFPGNGGYDDSTQFGRLYRDLYDVCAELQTGVGSAPAAPAAVATAAANVQAAIGNAVIWNGHNGNDLNAHGVSIDFSDATTFAAKASDYSLLSIAKDGNHWPTFLSQAP